MRIHRLYPGRLRNFIPLFGLGIGLTTLILSLFLLNPPLLRQIDLKLYDHFLADTTGGDLSQVPLVIDIDEQSLQRYGQWPWPRYRLALMIQRLIEAGAAAVALDIVLAEEDRTSPDRLLESLRDELGVTVSLDGLPPELRNNDALMAQTIAGAPVVLGGFVRFAAVSGKHELALPPGITFAERNKPGAPSPLAKITRGGGVIWPVSTLTQAAPVAFFNVSLDQDGLVRRVPMLLRIEDQVYPSLPLRSLMVALDVNTLRLTSGPDGLERIGLGRLSFPVDPDASMLVPFRGGTGTFPYISAAKILDGTFNPDAIKGRIAFMGTSATGLLDYRSTPLDRYTPGVEVHATVVDAILSGRSIVIPPWNTGLQVLLISLTGLLCLAAFGGLRPSLAAVGGGMLATAFYLGSEHLFGKGMYVTPLWGMLTVGVEGAGIVILRLWHSEHDKRRIRNVVSRYVSPEIVSDIVERGESVLRGEERELSIMFTDLRGFTSLSEKLSPEGVVSLLNSYFTPMTALVRGSQGTLDKFIGDALMAFWNAPLDVPQHPRKAVETALAMQDALVELNVELEAQYGFKLHMGAGIHTGPAHVGNMGSSDLTSYTAIGDAVNLASRLEGLCSRYGVPLVMSADTAARCGEGVVLQRLARLRVKGRQEAVDVFTGMRLQEAEARAEELEQYSRAHDLRDQAILNQTPDVLEQSRALFAELAKNYPQWPLYRFYADDCAKLLLEPPTQWSGVWNMTSK